MSEMGVLYWFSGYLVKHAIPEFSISWF